MGRPRTPRRSLTLRATLLAAWVWSQPWWARALFLLIAALPAAPWFASTSRPTAPPGAVQFADWLVERFPDGSIRVADPAAEHDPARPRSRTLMVTLRETSGWPAKEAWGAVVLVRDTTRVHVTSSSDPNSDLNRLFLPDDHPRHVIGSPIAPESARPYLEAVAEAVAGTQPEVARRVLAPDHTRRRIHWPGLRYLFVKAALLTLAFAGLGAACSLVALHMGFGTLAVRRARALGNACPRCGYDLTGLATHVCPECGSTDSAHRFESSSSVVPAIADSYEHA